MKKVYILHHVHEFESGEEDVKLIGVFSSKEKALKAVDDHGKLPGFKDHLNGFSIDEYIIDKSEWNEGFATLD